jgi:hypothetical protein
MSFSDMSYSDISVNDIVIISASDILVKHKFRDRCEKRIISRDRCGKTERMRDR